MRQPDSVRPKPGVPIRQIGASGCPDPALLTLSPFFPTFALKTPVPSFIAPLGQTLPRLTGKGGST